jgi:hypothetical protein
MSLLGSMDLKSWTWLSHPFGKSPELFYLVRLHVLKNVVNNIITPPFTAEAKDNKKEKGFSPNNSAT